VFSAESINDMLRLHTAKVIQNDVAEEIPWLNSNIQETRYGSELSFTRVSLQVQVFTTLAML
jgi:hypothetical protein